MEADSGSICIDGVDIKNISLQVLRSNALSVVPQDPTLFQGTIRYNLDPFNHYSDTTIWDALEKVNLATYVQSLAAMALNKSFRIAEEDPLMYQIEESGGNLSVGQRQLFCFARALIRNTKIICIDEGTSSVDEKSDRTIQKALRLAFRDHTLLVVAHRLNTVRNLDYICVMDNGKCVEFAAPDDLLQDPTSSFSSLWNSFTQGS